MLKPNAPSEKDDLNSLSHVNRFNYHGYTFFIAECGPASSLSVTEYCFLRLRRAARCTALLETKYKSKNVALDLDTQKQEWTWTLWSGQKITETSSYIKAEELLAIRREIIGESQSEINFELSSETIRARRIRLHGVIRSLLDALDPNFDYPAKRHKQKISLLMSQSTIHLDIVEIIIKRIANGSLSASAIEEIAECCEAEGELMHFIPIEDNKSEIVMAYGEIIAERQEKIKETLGEFKHSPGWIDHHGDYLFASKSLINYLNDDFEWKQDDLVPAPISDLAKEYLGRVFWSVVKSSGGNQVILMRVAARFSTAARLNIRWETISKLEVLARAALDSYEKLLNDLTDDEVVNHLNSVSKALTQFSKSGQFLSFTMACWAVGSTEEDDWVVIHEADRSIGQVTTNVHAFDAWTGSVLPKSKADESLLVRKMTILGQVASEPYQNPFDEFYPAEELVAQENISHNELKESIFQKDIHSTSGTHQSKSCVHPIKNSDNSIEVIKRKLSKKIKGQDNACGLFALSLSNHLRGHHRSGVLLIKGGTGTGKTYMISQASEIMGNVPICFSAGSSITPEGIRGMSLSHCLYSLIDKAQGNLDLAERGILVIDEFDKLVMASNHTGYEQTTLFNILRIADGNVWGFGSLEEHMKIKSMSTRRLLIVLCGAWQDFESSNRSTSITGFTDFGASTLENSDDLALPKELLGRISRVIRMKEHTKESLLIILNDYKHGPWASTLDLMGNSWLPTDDLNSAIANQALSTGLGARNLTAIIETISEVVLLGIVRPNALSLEIQKALSLIRPMKEQVAD